MARRNRRQIMNACPAHIATVWGCWRACQVRAVYLHACLRYVQRDFVTNSSLRECFGIGAKNSAVASRLIKDTHVCHVTGCHAK